MFMRLDRTDCLCCGSNVPRRADWPLIKSQRSGVSWLAMNFTAGFHGLRPTREPVLKAWDTNKFLFWFEHEV